MSSQRTATHLPRVTTSPNASPSKIVHAVKRRRSVPSIAADTSLNVISRLKMPSHPVQVAIDFDNQKNPNVDVQAYAKVAGATWTYYVKSLKVVIGRLSETADEQHQTIDIDLGPAKVVSRRHAIIQYNQLGSVWEVVIIGRNGVKVNGRTWREGAVRLASGSIIEIGGVQMMFVLPDDSTSNITAADMISDDELDDDHHRHRLDPSDATDAALSSAHHRRIANHTRNSSQVESSPEKINNRSLTRLPSYPKGLKMVSQPPIQGSNNENGLTLAPQPEVQDLSSDECKDIKPPYSYATMITQAILSAPDGSMTLAGIYDYIASHYSYYRFSRTGWQNSIRHNLSLNKAFEKVPRRPDEPGKGMKWQVLPSYRNEYLRRARDGELTKRRTCDWDSRQHQPKSRNQSLSPSRKRMLEESEPEPPANGTGPTSLLVAAAATAGSRTPERQPVVSKTLTRTPEGDRALTSSALGSNHKRDVGDGGGSLTATPSPYHMYNPIGAIEAFTPDRGGASGSVNGILNTGGRSNLMSNAAQPPSQTSMMAISSSFGNLSQTPMPQMSNPFLGPPSSTGQHLLPSSYIPASSPAQFWKYMHLSSTPARPPGNGNGEFSPANKFSSPPILTTPPLQMHPHDPNHQQQHYFAPTGANSNIDGSEGMNIGGGNHQSGDRSAQQQQRAPARGDESIGDLQGVDLIRGFRRIGKTPSDEYSGMRSSPQQQQQQSGDHEIGGESNGESPKRNL